MKTIPNLTLSILGLSTFREADLNGLGEIMFNLPKLRSISFKVDSAGRMSDDGLWKFGKSLEKSKMEKIIFDLNIPDQSIYSYIFLIKCASQIKSLRNLGFIFGDDQIQINNVAIAQLSEAILQMRHINSLSLRFPYNRWLTIWQFKKLNEGLSIMKELTTLELYAQVDNEKDFQDGLSSLGKCLIGLEKLTYLKLECFKPNLFDEQLDELGKIFSQMKSIKKLVLGLPHEKNLFKLFEALNIDLISKISMEVVLSNMTCLKNSLPDRDNSLIFIQESELLVKRKLSLNLKATNIYSYFELLLMKKSAPQLRNLEELSINWSLLSKLPAINYLTDSLLSITSLKLLDLNFKNDSMLESDISLLSECINKLNILKELKFQWPISGLSNLPVEKQELFVESFRGLVSLESLCIKFPHNDYATVCSKFMESISLLLELKFLDLQLVRQGHSYNSSHLSEECFENLIKLAKLKEFRFKSSGLDENNSAILSQSLMSLPSLETVDMEIDGINFDTYILAYMYKIIPMNTNLRKLRIKPMGVGIPKFPLIAFEYFKEVFDNMARLSNLSILLGGFKIGPHHLVQLGNELMKLEGLKGLDIELTGGYEITNNDLVLFGESLKNLKNLERLHIMISECSSLLRSDVELFTEKLNINMELHSLNVHIPWKSITSILPMIKPSIHLSHNQFIFGDQNSSSLTDENYGGYYYDDSDDDGYNIF